MLRIHIQIKGIVQGVGFRPFIYRLAHNLSLTGFVRNTSYGVEIEVEGGRERLKEFLKRLSAQRPEASIIEEVIFRNISLKRDKDFVIKESKLTKGFTQLAPDIATCKDCLREFFDPKDRRYRFPFINCTNCGPRYSIIHNTPYDRKQTSMKEFRMCLACKEEFEDVHNRRFHAQPDCCFVCGPKFSLHSIDGKKIKTKNPIGEAIKLLKKGEIIAIKGIGGFHIACDATNGRAIKRLRILKNRPTKPFAIMARDINLKKVVIASREELAILKSPVAPIMLLKKRNGAVCKEVAPDNPYLGVMLPYAPVHYLLLAGVPYLVMTSANIADEPLLKDDREVRKKLKKLVSYYLTHNRKIINRCDDSVGFYLKNRGFSIIRRARGYVPAPIKLPLNVCPTLAVGPYLKNTFTLADKTYAYISPHIGDLDNLETLNFFDEMIEKYKKWFKIEPELIVHDLHPDYLSTKIALKMAEGERLKVEGVQHHIAHIVSCLGENEIFDKVIGIAFDGTGFGLDGRIWGSEFFVGDMKELKRVAHLEYLPLPGGEESIRRPYRIALAYLYKLFGGGVSPDDFIKGLRLKFKKDFLDEANAIEKMIERNYNLAYTSSMGRLFDCVSAMLGITREITYEAEAAINLEYVAKKGIKSFYSYSITEISDEFMIRIRPILEGILEDIKKKMDKGIISAKFHNTIVQFSLAIAKRLRKVYSVKRVVLSGGVFQNRYLLNLMIEILQENGFNVYTHHKLPANDGCISYGQVISGNLLPSK